MPKVCIGQCCDPNQSLIPGHLIPRHETLRAEYDTAIVRGRPVPHLVYEEVNPILPVPLEATKLSAEASAHWIEYLLTRLTPEGFDLVTDRLKALILFRCESPSGIRSNPAHVDSPLMSDPEEVHRELRYRAHLARRFAGIEPVTAPPAEEQPDRARSRGTWTSSPR